MKAETFVRKHLQGCYAWSPCRKTFVIKHHGMEVSERAQHKRSAWASAKRRIEAQAKLPAVDGKQSAANDN